MSRNQLGLLAVIAGVLACGCGDVLGVKGSGTPSREQRQVAPFTEVKVSGGIDVEIRIAPETGCAVTGDDNIVPLVSTESRGATLEISTEQSVRPEIPIRVALSTPLLSGLRLSGSCDADVRGVRGEGLDVRVSGSGDVDLIDVDVSRLKIDISGSGDVTASGSADRLVFEVSGSGEGKLGGLCTRATEFRVSGSGEAEVAVSESLEAKISGSGTVRYLGDPEVERKVLGASDVQRIGPLPQRCAAAAPPPPIPVAPAPDPPPQPDAAPVGTTR